MSRLFIVVTFIALVLSSCTEQPNQSLESELLVEREVNPSLAEIMQGLEADLAEVTHGIWTQDLDIITEAATRIAEHPKISAEQLSLIKAELGEEIGSFVQIDQVVHSNAFELAGSASDVENLADLFKIYHRIETGCYSCHTAYQERVSAVLSAPQ